jgi:hypothetical protein
MPTPEQIAEWRRKHGVGADRPPTQALPPAAATPQADGIAARDAALARMGATPTGDQWANLGIPEFMPGVEPKPQLTPEQHMVQGNALPWMMGAVFDIPGQTGAELFSQIPKVATGRWGELEAPTIFTEGATSTIEKFWDRPIWQQFLLGAAFDPLGPPIGLGTIRGLGRAALRGLGRGAADAAIPTTIPGQRALPPARPEAAAAIPGRIGPPLGLPGRVGQEAVGYGPSTTPERYVPMRDVGAQRALGPGVPPDPTPPPPRQTPALTGRVSPIEQAGQVADPRILNFIPRALRQTARGQVIGSTGVEQPAVFYRSTGTAGQQRVVSYSATRPGAMILEDAPGTVARGGGVEAVGLKAGSRVLQEGTQQFVSVVGRQRAAESSADFVKRVANSAREAGYDMVQFSRQPAVRNVLLNEDAVIRNYVTPRTPTEVLRPAAAAAAAVRPVVSEVGQRMLGPGIRPSTAETVGRVKPGTVISDSPGLQRIAVKRDPTIPYDAVGREVGEARTTLRGEIAASSDVGSPVWAVTPDGQVFNLPAANQVSAASMDVNPVRPPTLDFAVAPNGDTIIVPGAQAPRTGPMPEAWKRSEALKLERRLLSGEVQNTVPGAAAYDEAADALEAAEIVARLESTPTVRPRPRAEGKPFGDDMDNPFPRRSEDALLDEMDIPTHENVRIGIMRKFDGARNAAGLALEEFVTAGRKLILTASRQGLKVDREGMTPLFQALHGEIPAERLTPQLKQMYDEINKVRQLEDADMKAFIEKARGTEYEQYMAFDLDQFRDRMLATPDYFPQLWKKDGVEIATGQIGSRPGFTLPRAGTFSEMVAQGYTPMSWDPYKMMAMRRLAGVNWRETVTFLGRAKRNDLAVPFGDLETLGKSKTHRVPKGVGSAFEGRLVQTTDAGGIPQSIRTPEWALPNSMASFVETMWGRKPSAYLGDKEVIGYIRKFRNGFKSAKLFASFFQHMDISLRTSASLFTLHGLRRGGPLQLPSLAARLFAAQWNTGYRNTIRQRYLSTTPIKGHEDLGITYKMIVEEGLGVQGDISVIQREIADTLTDIERTTNPVGKARQKIVDANKFFQSGLFDGVYREGITWSLDNFIIPSIRKMHPTWSARQVAAEAASNANLMFSSLPQWQSVLKDPWMREFGQTLFFSTNETEGLLRSFFGTVKGSGKRFWLQYYGGMMLSLAFFGNLINMAATGKPLPPEAYSPIDVGNPYSFTGVGYSTRFMSPQLPQWMGFSGREGSPLHLDIVGQMDTAFRVASDPIGATAARVNVPVRAVVNQVRGTNFFGEELTLAQRPGQLLTDLYGPIGGTSAMGAITEVVPQLQTVLPEGESRMGVRGQLLEGIAGVGMRAERTGDYLTRISTGVYNEDTNYSDLERFQKLDVRRLPQVETELGLRQETALKREGAEGNYYAALDDIDSERTTKLGNLVMDIRMGLESYQVKDRYYDIETYGRGRRKQAGVDKEFEAPDVNDSDPNKRALAQNYAIYDDPRVKRPGDDLDFAMRDTILKETYLNPNSDKAWTEEQFKFVMRNTNTRPIPVEIFSQLGAKTQAKQLTSQMLREQFYRQMGRDDLADASRIRFYMLDAPFMMQPVTPVLPQAQPTPQPPVPQPAQRSPKQEQIEAWRQKHLVGANR